MSELESIRRQMQEMANAIALTPIREIPRKEDKVVWSPDWRCYCCQDKGTIAIPVLREVFPDYDSNIHGIPICNRCGVSSELPDAWKESGNRSFNYELCNALHEFSKLDYHLTLSHQAEQRRAAKDRLGELVNSF